MTSLSQLGLFAEYNRLMNQRQYAAVANLSDSDLCEDKGAFFKSIIGTLNHILVGDILWLKRFSVHPASSEPLAYITTLKTPTALDEILQEIGVRVKILSISKRVTTLTPISLLLEFACLSKQTQEAVYP